MERVKYYKSDKVLFQQAYSSSLKCILAPMALSEKTTLCLYIGVGGYGRSYAIGTQKIPYAAVGLTLFTLIKFHGKESEALFNDKDVKLDWGVEESYAYIKVTCPNEKAEKLITPLLALTDHFEMDNDQVEKAKEEYLLLAAEKKNKTVGKIREMLYTNSAMKEDPYGSVESIKACHLSSIKKFYADFYGPSYLTLFVIGGLKPEVVDNVCQRFVFHRHEEDKIDIKPFREDYSSVAQKYAKPSKKGQFAVAFKFPPRKDIYEKYGDQMFSDYELIAHLFVSKVLKNSSILNNVIAVGQGEIHQGGEDAFFYQEYETGNPEALKKDILDSLSNPKLIDFFSFRSFKKEYLLKKQTIYKMNPDEYLHLLMEAMANSFAEPSLTDQAYKKSLYKTKKFLEDFKKYPVAFIE